MDCQNSVDDCKNESSLLKTFKEKVLSVVCGEEKLKTKPKTTPECEQLMNMVIEGLKAPLLEHQKRDSARVALKRLCKKRCTKAIEYIMQVSCGRSPIDIFASEICKEATKCLNDLS